MAARKAPSLEVFAAANPSKSGYVPYLDTLPKAVRDQLLTSKVGHSLSSEWLIGQGYDRATQQMVSHWRKKNGWRA